MNPEERYLTDMEEADALFDQAEAAAVAATLAPDHERRRELPTEAARLHRLAWEVKRRAEDEQDARDLAIIDSVIDHPEPSPAPTPEENAVIKRIMAKVRAEGE